MSGQNDPKVALRVCRHVDSFPQLALCQLFNWRFVWPRRIFLVSPKREIYNTRRARPRGQYRRWRNYSRAPIHGLPRRLRIYHLGLFKCICPFPEKHNETSHMRMFAWQGYQIAHLECKKTPETHTWAQSVLCWFGLWLDLSWGTAHYFRCARCSTLAMTIKWKYI